MEKYAGVRFKVEYLSRELPKDGRIKELSYWCRKFHMQGLIPVIEGKSVGNLSFRLRKGMSEFIITASGLEQKGSLEPQWFVKVIGCDMKKNIIYASGVREPSSESILHYRIYELREDVNAIFHGHDPLITKYAKKLKLRETRKWQPYGSIELVRAVEEVLGENRFIIMKDHGFLSLGKEMKDAGLTALQIKKRASRGA